MNIRIALYTAFFLLLAACNNANNPPAAQDTTVAPAGTSARDGSPGGATRELQESDCQCGWS